MRPTDVAPGGEAYSPGRYADIIATKPKSVIAEPDFTVSLRSVPPSVVIIDEGQIPQDYWKPQPPRLDRQGLSAALKSGSAIPGAALSNSQMTISVRTK
jgi:hypothetical protein